MVDERFGSIEKMMKVKPFSVTRQQLYRVVNGEVNTTIKVARELSDALEVSLNDVYVLLIDAQEVRKGV